VGYRPDILFLVSNYRVTIHLSNNFSRTTDLAYFGDNTEIVGDDTFEDAALDGIYDGQGFGITVTNVESVVAACEKAFLIGNAPEAVLSDEDAVVQRNYYRAGNRSLSMGDMVCVANANRVSDEDGRYIVARGGFSKI
jgi:hypothetical protein